MSSNAILAKLKEPFHAFDVEWRVQRSGLSANGQPWAMVIPYITSRAIMERLDDVFGIDGWYDSYREWKGKGVLCSLSVKINDKWITKEDGADDTNIEATKGGLSDSLKRAGVKFGIGRYLYQLDPVFAVCSTDRKEYDNQVTFKKKGSSDVYGSWRTPDLPAFATPTSYIKTKEIRVIQKLMEEANIDKELFFEHFNLVDVSLIKTEMYDKIVASLEAKKAQANSKYAYEIGGLIQNLASADNVRILDAYNTELTEKILPDDKETLIYSVSVYEKRKGELKK